MLTMYTLKGIFPEPKKEQKKNFIKENMKQLKFIQGKSPRDSEFAVRKVQQTRQISTPAESSLNHVKSSTSSKSKPSLKVAKSNSPNMRKRRPEMRIKKGDMAEFLKRKELRQCKTVDEVPADDDNDSDSSGRVKDVGCQTIESNLSQKLAESTKLTVLYPKHEVDDIESKENASGDSPTNRTMSPTIRNPCRAGDDVSEMDKTQSRLNSILERKGKDPYLPSGYQKGVLPKYLRERKEQGSKVEGAKTDDSSGCPAGHVPLPDTERKETLRMLRNSFAELVSELNKMPVKTDTLRMRNRKMELEKQLAKLEEGIKVFSRPKVFVKIGE